MNQVNVSPDEFGEGGFGTAFRVIAQKLLVGQSIHSQDNTRCCQFRTKKWRRIGSLKIGRAVVVMMFVADYGDPNHFFCVPYGSIRSSYFPPWPSTE